MVYLRIDSKLDIFFKAMFYIALFLCVISFSYEHLLFLHNDMSFHYLFRRLRMISAIAFSIKLIYDIVKKRIKILELVAFVLLIPLMIYYISYFYDFDIDKMRFLNISLMFVLAVSGSDIDYIEIIKMVLFSMLISYISIGILCLLGNLEFWNTIAADGRYRNFVGFSWTDISYRFLFIVFYYFYLRKDQISNIELIIIMIANSILFYLTGARFCFLIVILMLLFAILIKYCDYVKDMLQSAIRFLPIFSIAVPVMSILLYMYYNPSLKLMSFMNNVLSGRLRLGNDAITGRGIFLLGNYFEFVGGFGQNGYYDFVDSGFLNFLMIYGWVAFVVLLLVLFYFSLLIRKKERYLHDGGFCDVTTVFNN